eukprot:jgi/Psemu1/11009/gm1.11009_g
MVSSFPKDAPGEIALGFTTFQTQVLPRGGVKQDLLRRFLLFILLLFSIVGQIVIIEELNQVVPIIQSSFQTQRMAAQAMRKVSNGDSTTKYRGRTSSIKSNEEQRNEIPTLRFKNLFEDKESFPACLLWMDDNNQLVEWLAYNYNVLESKYVVINVDQRSRAPSNSIIEWWQNRSTSHRRMTIVKWTETDWLSEKSRHKWTRQAISRIQNENITGDRVDIKAFYDRQRQREFHKACTKHLGELTDRPTDRQEYLQSITTIFSPTQLKI